eukprot:7082339-Pyramimonas_sp.AAC.1
MPRGTRQRSSPPSTSSPTPPPLATPRPRRIGLQGCGRQPFRAWRGGPAHGAAGGGPAFRACRG